MHAKALPPRRAPWVRPLATALTVAAVVLLVASWAIDNRAHPITVADGSPALRMLRLDSVNSGGRSKPLTEPVVAALRRLQGVEDVRPYAQFGIALASNGPTGREVLWATPRLPWIQPHMTRTAPGIPGDHVLEGHEIIAPADAAGVDNRALLGRTLRIEYTKATGPAQGTSAGLDVRVVGLYDNGHPGSDGESAAYVSDDLFMTLLKAQLGLQRQSAMPSGYEYPTLFVKTSSTRALPEVEDAIGQLGLRAQHAAEPEHGPWGLPRRFPLLGLALGVLLVLLCFRIGLRLGRGWSSSRPG